MDGSAPLAGITVVAVAVNLPGPAAAARLAELGAAVTKVEPPEGDPLAAASAALYERLTAGQTILRLDLKDQAGRERLAELLANADVLLTSSRPSALERMGLARDQLEPRYPRLVHVAIVGHPAPDQERPGHDLTYVALHGLLAPPALPRSLVADLGGGSPFYRLYEASSGWIAVAALEPRFRESLTAELGTELDAAFEAWTASEWEHWAVERDLPVAAVAD